jgi:RNA polymerase sigma-70 factor (ECF subfamily)
VLPWLRAGSDEAFNEVFRVYRPAVERYLATFMRADDASDVAQQVFIDLLTHRTRASVDPNSFEHWLFMIARHRGLDLLRKLGRVEATPAGDLEVLGDSLVDSRAEPHALSDVAPHMRRLPKRQREALALRYLYSCSTSEIADATGASRETVRKLESRGLARLREGLGSGGGPSVSRY